MFLTCKNLNHKLKEIVSTDLNDPFSSNLLNIKTQNECKKKDFKCKYCNETKNKKQFYECVTCMFYICFKC